VEAGSAVRPSGAEEGRSVIRQVWLFVEPFGMLEELEPGATWVPRPPEGMVADADRFLGFGGDLVTHSVRNTLALERIPHMTDVERAAYLTRRAGSGHWSCFSLRSGGLRYSIVIVREEAERASV
jgi:hypothetical protein